MSGRGVNHFDLTDPLCPPFLNHNSSYSPRALTKASIWDGFIEGSSPSPISVVPKFMARMVVVSAHSVMRCTGDLPHRICIRRFFLVLIYWGVHWGDSVLLKTPWQSEDCSYSDPGRSVIFLDHKPSETSSSVLDHCKISIPGCGWNLPSSWVPPWVGYHLVQLVECSLLS